MQGCIGGGTLAKEQVTTINLMPRNGMRTHGWEQNNRLLDDMDNIIGITNGDTPSPCGEGRRGAVVEKYFTKLTPLQRERFAALEGLYREWNDRINVISRKDIDNLYEHHVLHSLAIAREITFSPGTEVMDLGTGGGFPGIPLAILMPEVKFHLIDSIGKKIKVVEAVRDALKLDNVSAAHRPVQEEKGRFDFIVSRAVMPLPDLLKLVRKNIRHGGAPNALPPGLLCLKGGDIQAETASVRRQAVVTELRAYFEEEFFMTKKLIYVPL